eukprot:7468761-Pyramimonas_sp.AAC.2
MSSCPPEISPKPTKQACSLLQVGKCSVLQVLLVLGGSKAVATEIGGHQIGETASGPRKPFAFPKPHLAR